MTTNWLERPNPLSLDEYLALAEDARAEIEVVDGIVTLRERRDRAHQKTAFRLAEAVEAAAAKFRRDHGGGEPPCVEVNTEVELVLWEVPLTVRKPDAVAHRCLGPYEGLTAADVLIVAEIVSRWSDSRDRIHKKGEYAKAGIPHYLIVDFDEIGAVAVEHYALLGGERTYSRLAITHRDRDPCALNLSDPFTLRVEWRELEVAPRG
ncbi:MULTISPECIES: Uma2 family endonuclease [Actinomadura]|uniref:Uma2 family endonuclease n=2 Tax=Actinomadura yumaensis TaxID=111807 RepID=A0ABW2CAJ0_9ACTN|nr:Uma2 family endonuclease [Actinomadura sp. J1-007]